jgi:carbon-monoxide dehydrogenase large subunit
MVPLERIRADQAEARERGVYRGIGFASFIELTNPSPFMYGIGGARISAQDGCTVRMDPDGSIVASSGVTEQGQGTEAILAQIVAHGVGVPVNRVKIITGDTQTTPYGGGTWACRGAGIGGEAALQSAIALKQQILEVAGAMLQAAPETLDIAMGEITDKANGKPRMPTTRGRVNDMNEYPELRTLIARAELLAQRCAELRALFLQSDPTRKDVPSETDLLNAKREVTAAYRSVIRAGIDYL